MKDKRIILNVSTELHSKLKQYADKDERTLNVVLRKILLAGVTALNIEKDILGIDTVNKLGNNITSEKVVIHNVDKLTEEQREELLKDHF
jgi:hypothetical protein